MNSYVKSYGMFSAKGNEVVQSVVDIARNCSWNWFQVEAFMRVIAADDAKGENQYQEITDTVVREAVYVELNFHHSH